MNLKLATTEYAERLAQGPWRDALSALFLKDLRWLHPHKPDSTLGDVLAESGGHMAVFATGLAPTPDPNVLWFVPAPDDQRCDLLHSDGRCWHRIRLDRKGLGGPTLAQLEHLLPRPTPDLAGCFDVCALHARFHEAYVETIHRWVPEVTLLKGKTKVVESPMEPPDVAETFLHILAGRAVMLWFVQERGWLEFEGRKDYVFALYEDWKKGPPTQRFFQRLAMLRFLTPENAAVAQALLKPYVGTVRFRVSGLCRPGVFEREFAKEGFGLVPDGLYEDLLGNDGLLRRFDHCLDEMPAGPVDVALTPAALGFAYDHFHHRAARPEFEHFRQHFETARKDLAAHLNLPMVALRPDAPLPTDPDSLDEIKLAVQTAFFADPDCGSGSYLVAMLHLLSDFTARLGAAREERVPSMAKIKRDVLETGIQGLAHDHFSEQVTRFRLGLSVLASETSSHPGPMDLVRAVQAVATRGIGRPELHENGNHIEIREGPKQEFKSTLEWDSRRNGRNPELRFASLKTIAAFLNSEGGTLWIGIDDHGKPVGLDGDLSLLDDPNPYDMFENRLREFMKNQLEPIPLNHVRVHFKEVGGFVVCRIDVLPRSGVTYLIRKDAATGKETDEVFVRDGNRTLALSGRARDQFVVQRSE